MDARQAEVRIDPRRAREGAQSYGDGCQVPLLAVESPECRYGPARNDTTVVLFGDSHAAQWFPALDSVASMRGWSLVNLTKTGCPSVLVGVPNVKLGRRYTECERWREYAVRRITALKPQLVVVTSDRSYQVYVGDSLRHTDSSAVARREWHDGIVRTLSRTASFRRAARLPRGYAARCRGTCRAAS